MPSGEIREVMGYEPFALNELLKEGILESDILTLSGPKRWETNNFVSLLYIKFIMRSGKGYLTQRIITPAVLSRQFI